MKLWFFLDEDFLQYFRESNAQVLWKKSKQLHKSNNLPGKSTEPKIDWIKTRRKKSLRIHHHSIQKPFPRILNLLIQSHLSQIWFITGMLIFIMARFHEFFSVDFIINSSEFYPMSCNLMHISQSFIVQFLSVYAKLNECVCDLLTHLSTQLYAVR